MRLILETLRYVRKESGEWYPEICHYHCQVGTIICEEFQLTSSFAEVDNFSTWRIIILSTEHNL